MSQVPQVELLVKVRSVITDVLKVKAEQVRPESRFAEDLGADSLDRISLLMALEEEFKAEITDEEAARLLTVGDALELIRVKKGEQ